MPQKNEDGTYRFEIGPDGLPMLPDMGAYEEQSGYDDEEVNALLADFNKAYKRALAEKTNKEMTPKPPEKSSHQKFIEKASPAAKARMEKYLEENPDARARIASFNEDGLPEGAIRIIVGHPAGPSMADHLASNPEEMSSLAAMDEQKVISRLLEIAEKAMTKNDKEQKEEFTMPSDEDVDEMSDADFIAMIKEKFESPRTNQRAVMSPEEIAKEEEMQRAYNRVMNARDRSKGRKTSGAMYTRPAMAR